MIEEKLFPMSHWNDMYGFNLDADKFLALLKLVGAVREATRTNRPAQIGHFWQDPARERFEPQFSIRLIRDVLWKLHSHPLDYQHLRDGLRKLAAIDRRPPWWREPEPDDLANALGIHLTRANPPQDRT